MTSRTNQLSERLRNKEPLLGFYYGYPAEGILETIGPGWDFVWIDGQHGQLSFGDALSAVRAASWLGLETVLRVPTHDPGLLSQYADTAPSAMMIPQVDSAEMATAIVRALRFPPQGNRSYGGRRVIDVNGHDYYRSSEPLIMAQIESRIGLKNVEQIVAVDGIDGLFFGCDDFKLSLGLPIETCAAENESIQIARGNTARAAQSADKWSGTSIGVSELSAHLDMGYQLLAIGSDVGFLRQGSRQALNEGRSILHKSSAEESADGDRVQTASNTVNS
ncbi:HpcH/HpaI aldolase family protein [Adhaeretor mobilis]|uniref:4-hydroxy-2-oxovalerate aldolase n=1 Tax=Adhaeretor mobilis TaxID=1930276 RepID=A0A517MZU4_9BACT|nr:aldolase/citrate lyase family protein [Adhaeretor mobilis]QDT00403.1 4-hydroxy-2-oxovalerate aldolase [Adhaeretor mobilis]